MKKPDIIPEPVNRGLEEGLFKEIVRINKECSFFNFMGLYLTALSYEQAELMLLVSGEHINPRDIAHGAVSFAMLDTVMGMAIRTVNMNVVTVQSTMNHMKAVQLGDLLTAKGKVVDYGKKIIIAEAELFNQDNEIVGISRNTFYYKGVFYPSEG